MKKIIIVLGAIAAITILGIGIYHSDASQKSQLLSQNEITDLIHSQYPGEITKIKLNEDSKTAIYDVSIKGDKAKYELKMDATSGEVLKLKETKMLAAKENPSDATGDKSEQSAQKNQEKEEQNQKDKEESSENKSMKTSIEKKNHHSQDKNKQDDKQKQQIKKDNNQGKKSKKDTVITKEEAIQIALGQFSGEVDDVDLEEENGRLIYEIEIERGDLEAEIEIDAYTGEVLIMEIDD